MLKINEKSCNVPWKFVKYMSFWRLRNWYHKKYFVKSTLDTRSRFFTCWMRWFHRILFFAGSETVIPSTSFPGHFVKEPSEATVKHWALKIMKEKSSAAFVVLENLFKDPTNYSKKVLDSWKQKQVDPMVCLAMIVDIGLSETEYCIVGIL